MSDVAPGPETKVVAVATIKGGSGKTTAAVCLAAEWLYIGQPTALIDCDPQQSARRWAFAGSELELLRVETCDLHEAEALRSCVSQLAAHGFKRIVIDTPGFEAPVLTAAIEVADLALVPLKASPVDYQVAADTLDIIRPIVARRSGERPLRVAMMLTQVTPRSVIARHMRAQLDEAGHPLLTSELANRVAYTEAPFLGSTPGLLSHRSGAAREVKALRQEIDALLTAAP